MADGLDQEGQVQVELRVGGAVQLWTLPLHPRLQSLALVGTPPGQSTLLSVR